MFATRMRLNYLRLLSWLFL